VVVLREVSRTQDGKPDREGLRLVSDRVKRLSFGNLPEILRRKIGDNFIKSFLEIGDLEGPAEGVRDLDVPCLIEEDVIRSHIAQPLPHRLRLPPPLRQAKQQKPNLSLCELPLESLPVVDLLDEEVGVIFEGALHVDNSTISVPVFPQSPALEKLCDLGRNKLVVLAWSYFKRPVFHRSYSFSSTDCDACSHFSPSRETILDLDNRGWFISN
jgi:hypothetical protein